MFVLNCLGSHNKDFMNVIHNYQFVLNLLSPFKIECIILTISSTMIGYDILTISTTNHTTIMEIYKKTPGMLIIIWGKVIYQCIYGNFLICYRSSKNQVAWRKLDIKVNEYYLISSSSLFSLWKPSVWKKVNHLLQPDAYHLTVFWYWGH